MKKATALVIVGVFVLSVVVVSFFGLQLSSFNVRVPATKIEFVNDDIKFDSVRNLYYISLKYSAESPESGKYQLSWRITPDEVTNKNVRFSLPQLDASDTRVVVSERGFVEMNSMVNVFVVRITTTDGTNLSQDITFRVTPLVV